MQQYTAFVQVYFCYPIHCVYHTMSAKWIKNYIRCPTVKNLNVFLFVFKDDFVLVDDVIIVLTKVDIRRGNPAGETDESDDGNSDDELKQYYIWDEKEQEFEIESDIDDFIDDRPEEELCYNTDVEDEQQEEEGMEYDSDPGESSESSSEDDATENQPENDNNNENTSTPSNNINNKDDDDEDDESDDDIRYVSPSKKAKLDVLDSSESSESGSDSEDEQRMPSTSTIVAAINEDVKDVNKFGVYLLPKIDSV